jgi:hypothetical protein
MIHYVTEDFVLKVITLRCAPFNDVRHTSEEFAKIIKERLEEARIPIEFIVVYVTDNASNATKSARELGIDPANHHKCVSHTLSLVVQKFI